MIWKDTRHIASTTQSNLKGWFMTSKEIKTMLKAATE